MRVIKSDACVAEGADWLSTNVSQMAEALCSLEPLPLRLKPDGFSELLSAIVSQQVSVASANAIWCRMLEANLATEPEIRNASEDQLKQVGLSRQKVRYAKALASAKIDYDGLRNASTSVVVETLIEVPGIGRWTAEIYAMFSLGHADVFAPGDLALQEGARMLFDLDKRPTEKELRIMAEEWSPWRSVAARLLWAYYAKQKTREGIR